MICPRCEFPNEDGVLKCFICGFQLSKNEEFITQYISHLPKVDYKKNNWTSAQQLRKIGEEFGEVAEAIAEENPVQTIRESLDAMQTLDTLIRIVAEEYNMSLDRFYKEHEEKLRRKGYL